MKNNQKVGLFSFTFLLIYKLDETPCDDFMLSDIDL